MGNSTCTGVTDCRVGQLEKQKWRLDSKGLANAVQVTNYLIFFPQKNKSSIRAHKKVLKTLERKKHFFLKISANRSVQSKNISQIDIGLDRIRLSIGTGWRHTWPTHLRQYVYSENLQWSFKFKIKISPSQTVLDKANVGDILLVLVAKTDFWVKSDEVGPMWPNLWPAGNQTQWSNVSASSKL